MGIKRSLLFAMSTPTAQPNPATTAIPEFAIEIIEMYMEQIRPALNIYAEGAVFIGIMISLVLSFFYFSTPRGRQSFIWKLVAFNLFFVLLVFSMAVYLAVRPKLYLYLPGPC
jgi:hypothetical protein